MILRLYDSKYDPRYLSRYLSLDETRHYFESYSIGAIMDSLSSSTLLGLTMLVPPVQEQVKIIDFVEAETRRFDTLTSEAQRAIDLLLERRTALISAAVTGQFDVRAITARTAA
jgi:type I restriction enzyme S subunit